MLSPLKTSDLKKIQIKSPKSDVKMYRSSFDGPKTYPELALGGNVSPTGVKDFDKVTQAWNRLKINVLSKAIAMSPYIKSSSFGPQSDAASELTCNSPDFGGNVTPTELKIPVTSTPLKPAKLKIHLSAANESSVSLSNKPEVTFDLSSIKSNEEIDLSVRNEISELEKLREKCLNRIEAQVWWSGQKKKEDFLKKHLENEEKVKKKLEALKVELDNEFLLSSQKQYTEAQNLIKETRASAQVKANQLQQTKLDHEKKVAETNEKIKQIELKRKELEEKQKLEREELSQRILAIHELQVSYNQNYTLITEMIKKCKDTKKLNEKVAEELPKLREMNELLLKLIDRCKDGKVSSQDLKSAEALVQKICVLSEVFNRHTYQINRELEQAEENKRKEEEAKELKAKQEEAEKQQKAKEETEKIEKERTKRVQQKTVLSGGLEDCISGECLKWHAELSKFLKEYEKNLQPLLMDGSFKNFRFDCQKLVNVPVNAISPLDDIHLQDKLYKLSRLLLGKPVPKDANSMFLVTGHPLGVAFCTNLLAKKFVKQGEHAVSSKPEAAFAIAAVIVALWADFPDFGKLLLAHFHRECPYLIPAFLPQVEGQSNEDYYKMLGYQYSEEGKVETQDMFLRRMSGVMRLYAAILVTPLPRSKVAEGRKHPHGMEAGWRWLTASLNLRPRTDISPTLIFDFLEVTGFLFFLTYRSQFSKLLHFLCADYFPLIEQVTPDGCGGPVVRLKSFLEKVLKEGRVPPPAGLLPPNFW